MFGNMCATSIFYFRLLSLHPYVPGRVLLASGVEYLFVCWYRYGPYVPRIRTDFVQRMAVRSRYKCEGKEGRGEESTPCTFENSRYVRTDRTCCSLYFRYRVLRTEPTGFMAGLKLDSCQLRFFQFAYVIVLINFLSTVIFPPAREQA